MGKISININGRSTRKQKDEFDDDEDAFAEFTSAGSARASAQEQVPANDAFDNALFGDSPAPVPAVTVRPANNSNNGGGLDDIFAPAEKSSELNLGGTINRCR